MSNNIHCIHLAFIRHTMYHNTGSNVMHTLKKMQILNTKTVLHIIVFYFWIIFFRKQEMCETF